jgi:nucleoside-diphosphate-sugar epimerase
VSVFLAGATGVIGRRLVPLLVAAGHEVAGMTRSESKVDLLREWGARPVVCDVFDRDAVVQAVLDFAPTVMMNQLTDLPDDVADVRRYGEANARIRREGTRNLLAAATAGGVDRFIVQSVAWTMPGDAGAAVDEMEQMVLAAGGVVLRYGQFYGPGTYHEGQLPEGVRVDIDAAATRTLDAFDAPPGILTIVDE